MKKKGILFISLFFVLILSVSFTLAASGNESAVVKKAYSCLENTVSTRGCSQLSLDSQIFSLLTIGKCKDEVLKVASPDNACWPKGNCDLKTTALATLALNNLGINTTASENWMLSKRGVPEDVNWFLEVASANESNCTISYGNKTYNAGIYNNEKVWIDSNTCLSPENYYGGYWFNIANSCYKNTFTVSCNKHFLTTLLFKKADSSTLFVLDKSHPSSAEGETSEKINSVCFEKGSSCDYEGSLWASMVLNYLHYNMDGSIPYLLTGMDSHPELLPSSFLYKLTGKSEFRTDILSKQINKEFWKVSGNKFYDTAVALLPFQSSSVQEKDNTKEWLTNTQGPEGCWDNKNVLSNAFILYSIWPKINDENGSCSSAGYTCVDNASSCGGDLASYSCSTGVCCNENSSLGNDNTLDCTNAGYFCMSGVDCSGQILSDYSCTGMQTCCNVQQQNETCSDLGGTQCNSSQYCSGNLRYDSSGDACCIGGGCEVKVVAPENNSCESNSGICETDSCSSGYETSSSYSCSNNNICCMKTPKSSGSYWWIWVLFILTILVAGGIMFKDKLREFLFRMKGGKGPVSDKKRPPRFPPSYQRPNGLYPSAQKRILSRSLQKPILSRPLQRPAPRRMGPGRVMPKQRIPTKTPKELDDVLKKLKDMSK